MVLIEHGAWHDQVGVVQQSHDGDCAFGKQRHYFMITGDRDYLPPRPF